MKTYFKGKGKFNHLNGTGPSDDPSSIAWDKEDSMIMSWLWNSMLLGVQVGSGVYRPNREPTGLDRFVLVPMLFGSGYGSEKCKLNKSHSVLV